MKRLMIQLLLAGLFFPLAGVAQLHLTKAIVVPENVDSMIKIERRLKPNYQKPAPAGKNWVMYLPGQGPILFLAGHATAQKRDGKIKQADGGTGSLALELHALKNVPVLYTTYLSPSDPNYYDDNAFKDTLAKLLDILKPALVIDLHGSHPWRPYDVDFGTMNRKSYKDKEAYLDSLVIYFTANGLSNLSLDYFPAAKAQTNTKFVSGKGYPCIQLEINSTYLEPDTGDVYAKKTADLLQSLIVFINNFKP